MSWITTRASLPCALCTVVAQARSSMSSWLPLYSRGRGCVPVGQHCRQHQQLGQLIGGVSICMR